MPSLSAALKSFSFKNALPQFLSREWVNPAYAAYMESREVFLTFGESCVKYTVDSTRQVQTEEIDELRCNHEEADTRIVLHCFHADNSIRLDSAVISVRSSDTDVAILLLRFAGQLNSELWMDLGTGAKRGSKNISELAKSIDSDILDALPGLHAFTGCDTVSAFSGKGKVKPFKIVEKERQFCTAFKTLSEEYMSTENVNLKEEIHAKLEMFVCRLYGGGKVISSLQQLRHRIVEKSFKLPKIPAKNVLGKIKGLIPSSLPPCKIELVQHIQRAAYVSSIWLSSNKQRQPILQTPMGWGESEEGRIQPVWFVGEQMPNDQLVPERQASEEENSDSEDSESESSDDEDDDC